MNNASCFCLWIASCFLAASPALALIPASAATRYGSTTWTQEDGLPVDMIRSIAQTSDGFLWIATDEGLARFDGHDFTVFGVSNGALPNDYVTTLAAAHDGSLWIGTSDGLVHYSGGKFVAFGGKQSLPSPSISALYEDRNSTLWVASGGRLWTIRNGNIQIVPPQKLAPLTFPHAFYEDRKGTLWIAGAGLIRREGDGFVPVLGAEQMRGLIANALAEDRDGTLWIGANLGILARRADGQVRRYETPDRIPNRLVRALWIDRDGVVWAGTNGGLIRFQQDRFTLQSVSASPQSLSIRALLEDREGNLWMGTGIGLWRLRDRRFTSFGQGEGWPADAPTAVLADRKGNLWVGYHDSGLLQVALTPTSAKPVHHFTVSDGLVGNEVYSLREARNGDLLIATRAGLSRMHDGRFENATIADRLKRPLVLDVLDDPYRGLVVASAGELLVKDGAGWRVLASGSPVALAKGSNDDIWAGTNAAGLFRIPRDGRAEHFTKAEGLSSNRIRTLLWDDHNVLWIGTFGGGLVRFDGKSFHSFTVRDGLPSDNVAHINSDGEGNFWLSTTRGIARVSVADLESAATGHLHGLSVTVYGPDDGLQSLEAGPKIPVAAGGTRTPDGRIWFITGMSIAATDPALPDPQPLLLGASLLEVSAGGKTLDASHEARIEAGTGPIQLRFTALHLRAPQSVRYEYQLQGLDSDWSAPTSQRSITYNVLPHGTYRFRVRALLGGQRSSEASFAFLILPRFYETAWFLWLCIGSALAVAWLAYQWRQRQIHARFALIIAERTRLAREIHDTLAQGFFGISSQLEALSLRLDDPVALRRELNLARRMARHSLAEARRSVTDLRNAALEDLTLSDALASSARQWTEGSPVEVKLRLGKTMGLRPDVEQNLLRIAQEAVANAMKHARPSSIGIDLDLESENLKLRVRDDGCGFDASRSLNDAEGHFGLIGMQERARMIGGMFQVSSNPGQGTTIEVTVPV
jgi:signal transduction histidine kinase/ligand-binding sensor domain-containing protein